MYYIMSARITFLASRGRREIVIGETIEVTIQSTWREFASTAEITFPRDISFLELQGNGLYDKKNVKDIFRQNDPVKIELGYDENYIEEFTGYISHVGADIPTTIKCQDEMWKLGKLPVNYSAASVTLEKLLRDICPGYSIDALEGVNLGAVRLPNTTVGAVLKKLKDDYNLYSYMKGKQLVCGKYYSDDSSLKPVPIVLERDTTGDNLTYKTAEETIVKITANSILPNGTKIKYEIGETGGDNLTLTYYGVETKAELEKKARIDYEKAKRDKLKGTITAYGGRVIRHGMKADVKSELYADRNGLFYIEGITKKFDGSGGYRHEITIGDKVQ